MNRSPETNPMPTMAASPRPLIRMSGYLLLLLAGVGCEIAVIRPLDPATGKAILEDGPSASDPAAYAHMVWTTHLPSILEDRAVDIDALRAALQADEEEAVGRFGHREAGRPASFLASGNGRVTRLDTTSRVGLVHVDLEPVDGVADLHIQIGPVIRGTALRDALPLITFNTFDNQVAYAAVSRELHRIVADSVLARFDLSHLEGAIVSFRGAFTLGSDGPILLTPVTLEREE